MIRLNVLDSKELTAVLVALRGTVVDVQRQFRRAAKTVTSAEFARAMAEHTTTRLEARALTSTARVTVSNQNIRLSAATVGKPLPGGLNPKTQFAGVEFGVDRTRRTTYQATRNGHSYTVSRRNTTAQLRTRNRRGYVFWPAVASVAPRIAALYVQTFVRTLAEAFEGKTS